MVCNTKIITPDVAFRGPLMDGMDSATSFKVVNVVIEASSATSVRSDRVELARIELPG
jgi:hypothetical protein